MQNICVTTADNTNDLECDLNERNADFDSIVITCNSVDNSSSGVVYTAKFKEQGEAVERAANTASAAIAKIAAEMDRTADSRLGSTGYDTWHNDVKKWARQLRALQ